MVRVRMPTTAPVKNALLPVSCSISHHRQCLDPLGANGEEIAGPKLPEVFIGGDYPEVAASAGARWTPGWCNNAIDQCITSRRLSQLRRSSYRGEVRGIDTILIAYSYRERIGANLSGRGEQSGLLRKQI